VRRAALACAAALCLALAPAAGACPRTTLGDVEDEVMCPVCGTPLSTATEAPQAQRERELIVRLIDRCRSKEQIKATLAAEFGEDVLALPDDEGFDLAAYVVPALALLAARGVRQLPRPAVAVALVAPDHLDPVREALHQHEAAATVLPPRRTPVPEVAHRHLHLRPV
jgi:cytochrome c-type biogenesis protein CcmH/NrfF